MATTRDLLPEDRWFAGADHTILYPLYEAGVSDEDVKIDPDAGRLDTSAYLLQWELRTSRHTVTTTPPVSVKSSTSNEILSNADTGPVEVNVFAGDTSGLPEGWYWLSLWKMNDGAKSCLASHRGYLRNPQWS